MVLSRLLEDYLNPRSFFGHRPKDRRKWTESHDEGVPKVNKMRAL